MKENKTALTFWQVITAQLDEISSGADTFNKVKSALDNVHGNTDEYFTRHADSKNHAQFYGSGGDRSLGGALRAAGWHIFYLSASYHYNAKHPATMEALTYTEGDVDRN